MGFFDSIGSWFNGIFGGNDEEERKRRQQQAQKQQQPKAAQQQPIQVVSQKPAQNISNAGGIKVSGANNVGQIEVSKPKQVQQSAPVLFQTKKTQPVNKTEELNNLTKANLDQARRDASRNNTWFENVFNRNDTEARAQTLARNRAVSQYQDKYGWNADPDITAYNNTTMSKIKEASDNTRNFNKAFDETLKASSEIPVVSDFMNMGASGANLITNAGLNPFGSSEKDKQEAHNNWTKIVLGMSDEEIAQLPKEQQDRLRKMQIGLSVASPVMGALDIASLGETGAAIGGIKNAAVQGGKQAAITAAKAEGKNIAKNAAIAGVAAPLIGAPIQNYVQNGNALDFNGFDISQIPKQSATAALWSTLLPGKAKEASINNIIKGVAKESDPSAIQSALKVNPEAAVKLANANTANDVKEVIKELSVDPSFVIDPKVKTKLQEAGITAVKKDENDPYAASYKDNEITARNQQNLDENVYHEMGHSLWEKQLTPEEKALFNGEGDASKQSVGRNGYTQDNVNSEDFSDYINKALNGKLSVVPEKYRTIIAKYAKVALSDAETSNKAAENVYKNEAAKLKGYFETNQNLTPEQIQQATNQAKKRAADLTSQLEANRANSIKEIDQQIAQGETQAAKLQAQVEEANNVREAQQSQVPMEGTKTSHEPIVDPQLDINNAYKDGVLSQFEASQQQKLTAAEENPISRFFRIAKEQLYDPYSALQKADNKGAVGDDSLVSLAQREHNPQQAVQVRLQAPIRLPDGTTDSVWNIIKKYGKEGGTKAQEFANYRMYKDELWRSDPNGGGMPVSLSVDGVKVPREEMAARVQRYESEHPDAVRDNAVLRQFELNNLKERADAGVDAQATYEASAKNPFYSPRTRAITNNKDLKMSHNGGFTTTSKSTFARTGADVAYSPLDLYRIDAQNTEIGVLRNKLGEHFYNRAQDGQDGYTISGVDPYTAVQHREARKTFEKSRQDLQDLRDLRDSLKTDKKMTSAEINAVGKKASAIEDRAISKMREALQKASNDPSQTLHDVAARDPQYEVDKSAIKAKYGKDRVITTEAGTTLSPEEKIAQMKQEISDLDNKYPDPNITTRKELLELAQSLDSGQYTPAQLAEQATNLRQQIPDLEQRLDALTGQLNQTRSDVGDAKDASSQAWKDLEDTTQHQTDFNGNEWTFKVDGEIGKGTVPAEIAAEMSRLREFAKPDSKANLFLRGAQAVGSATKAFWTGAFAPVWQTLNVAKNFGLMLHNGNWLSALSPRAMQGFIEGLAPLRPEARQFINDLKSKGASYENITQSAAMRNMVADDIAARANVGTFLARNPVNTFKDLYHMTSAAYTHVANAQRNAIAFDAYSRAIKAGIPKEQAMHMAVREISNVFGDLQRVSELAQAMEPLIPYSGATQAGVRSLINKAKTSPAEFAVKQAAIIGGSAALTWYSMQNNAQYYQDQIDKGYTSDLDNNFTIVLPGATRDENGNWSGVVKIPVTPDFRAINSAAWQNAYKVAHNEGVDPGLVAGKLFEEFTGQMGSSIYDNKVAEKAGTPIAGVFTGSPALNVGKILTGINPTTGAPLSDSDMSLRPRTEQAYDSTSNFANNASELTNGALTPIQVDKLLGQFGNTGRALKDDEPGWGKFFDFKGALTGGTGQTDKQKETKQYFDNIDAVSRAIDPNDKKTLKEFQALHSKKTEQEKSNMMNSAVKASQMMQYVGDGSFQTTPLFAAEKALDTLQRQQGQPGNPLFDLPAQALQKVLTYRSLKVANTAGQNYSKGGESAFTSLGLDDQWYQDFRDKEDAYYKALNLDGGDNTRKSFSGAQQVQLSDEQKAAQAKYFSLDKTGRRAFLAQNPWLKNYWAADNEFTDQERQALGFNSLDGDNTYDGTTASSGGYSSGYRKGYGYGGSGYSSNGSNSIDTLTDLTNFSTGVNGDNIRSIEAAAIPNIVALFNKLKAGSGGGKTKPKIGASSSGR